MANQERFRDPVTGKFVSRKAIGLGDFLRELFGPGGRVAEPQLIRGGRPEGTYGEEEPFGANWNPKDSTWGLAWEPSAPGEALDTRALNFTSMPEGMDAWRVRYYVDTTDPRYPRGFASSGWLGPEDWINVQQTGQWLSLDQRVSPTGIAMIHFRSE